MIIIIKNILLFLVFLFALYRIKNTKIHLFLGCLYVFLFLIINSKSISNQFYHTYFNGMPIVRLYNDEKKESEKKEKHYEEGPSGTFYINNLNDLLEAKMGTLKNYFNETFSFENPEDTLVLKNDIDFENEIIEGSFFSVFSANLDGKNFKIKNLTLKAKNKTKYIGFIGKLIGGTIKNITFENVSFNIKLMKTSGFIGIIGQSLNNHSIQSKLLNIVVDTNKKIIIDNLNKDTLTFGILVGNSISTIFDNCDIILNGKNENQQLNIKTKGDGYFGYLCGKSGNTIIQNCSCNLLSVNGKLEYDSMNMGFVGGTVNRNMSIYMYNCFLYILNNDLKNLKYANHNYMIGSLKSKYKMENCFVLDLNGNKKNYMIEEKSLDNSVYKDNQIYYEEPDLNKQIYGLEVEYSKKCQIDENSPLGIDTLFKNRYFVYITNKDNLYGCDKYNVLNLYNY